MKLPKDARERLKAEFIESDLGDPRRTKRLGQVVEALSRSPRASLPSALATDAALEGTYRFLRNDSYDFDDILDEHQQRTMDRARAARKVLVLHDTTEVSIKHLTPQEVGYLQTGKAGFYLHVSMVVDAEHLRRPLGIVHAEPYFRKKRSRRGGRQLRTSGTTTSRWKDREFLRWHRGVAHSADRLDGCEVVHVMDREGDCYALLSEMVTANADFVVRCRMDRTLTNDEKLYETLASCEGVLERQVTLSRRAETTIPARRRTHPARPQRTAKLEFKTCSATLARPRSASKESLAQLELNVVRVHEAHPPRGQKPTSWTLWTTLPVDTAEQVATVVDTYRQRWLIEEYFKALKTGCSYESRQLESRHALLNLLAVLMPIAVEVLWLRARATDDPDALATEVVSPLQIEILRSLGHRPLGTRPTVAEVLLCIASLAGHQLNNGPPGWLILSRGYEKLLHYEVGWVAAQRRRRRKL